MSLPLCKDHFSDIRIRSSLKAIRNLNRNNVINCFVLAWYIKLHVFQCALNDPFPFILLNAKLLLFRIIMYGKYSFREKFTLSDAHTICAIFVVRWISSKALDRHETTHLLLIINGIFFFEKTEAIQLLIKVFVNKKKLNYSTLTRELLTQLKVKLLFSPAILTIITIYLTFIFEILIVFFWKLI